MVHNDAASMWNVPVSDEKFLVIPPPPKHPHKKKTVKQYSNRAMYIN